MNIAQVRAQYPQYQDLSDKQLADALHARFYSDIPIQDYYSRIGLTSPKERTFGEAAKDIAAGVVSGAGSLVQLPGQLYGLATGDFSETGALGLGKDIAKYGEEMKSAGLKAREAERAEKIKTAEEKGQWEAFKTAIGETVKDPALLTSFLAEQAPQLLVPFGAAKVAQVGTAAKAAAAAEGLVGKAAADAVKEVTQAAAERGTRAAIGAGAVQQGADVGSQAYEDIYKELIRKGAKPEDAAEGALNLARAAGASGAIVSLLAQRLPGARTLEESFAGVPGTSGRLLGAVKGALGEGISEVAEETGGKFGANLAMREVAPETSLTAGLGQTAGMAAIGGVGMGGISGAARRPAGKEEAPATEAQPAEAELRTRYEELKQKSSGTPEREVIQPDGTKITVPAEPGQLFTEEEQREYKRLKAMFEPEVQPAPEQVLQRVEDVTGVSRAAPPSAEESLLAGLYKLGDQEAEVAREELTRQRLQRQQEQIDAESERIAELNRRQGMPSPDRPKLEIAERPSIAEAPPPVTPRQELLAKQAEIDTRRLEAGLPTGAASETPGVQPAAVVAEETKPVPKIVDERPLATRAAKNRLLVMQNMLQNQGGDPASLTIVPHPTVEGKFAIQSLDVPTKFTSDLPRTAITRPETPITVDPVNAYVEDQRRQNTPAARQFVSDFDAGRITKADVENAISAERRRAAPPLAVLPEGEIVAPPVSRARPTPPLEAGPPVTLQQRVKRAAQTNEPLFVTTFKQDGRNVYSVSTEETLDTKQRIEVSLTSDEQERADQAQKDVDAIKQESVVVPTDLTSQEQREKYISDRVAEITSKRIAAEQRLQNILRKPVERTLADVEVSKLEAPKPPTSVPPAQVPPAPPPSEQPASLPKSAFELSQRLPSIMDKGDVRKANEDGDIKQLVDALKSSPNLVTRRIGELGQTIVNRVRLEKPGRLKKLNWAGQFTWGPSGEAIKMRPDHAGNEQVNAHEVVHALTVIAQLRPVTDKQKKFSQDIKDLYQHVKKELKKKGVTAYGLQDELEFTAEAMSNPNFQFELMQIPYPGKKSAWSKFVKSVADLLGITNTNALTEVMSLVEKIAETKAPRKKTTGVETIGGAGGQFDRPTANFLRWFGDSKVVDMNGEPLVVYHGSKSDITEFDPSKGAAGNQGMFFTTDIDLANVYGKDGAVYPVYVSIKNPLILQGNERFAPQGIKGKLAKLLFPAQYKKAEREQRIKDMLFDGNAGRIFSKQDVELLRREGYDGVVTMNAYPEGSNLQVIVAFEPTQIKSAIGNNGEYSLVEPSIIGAQIEPELAVKDTSPARSKLIDGETKPSVVAKATAAAQKALQKQPMPEKGLSHVSPELTNLAQPIFFPQNKTIIDRIEGMKDRFWQRLAQKTADQFRTIKEYSPTGYMQARLSKSIDGSLEGLLFHGQVVDDGGALNIKKNTKGMMDILKPIGTELDSYLMWVALNRESRLPENKRSKIPNMDQLVARRSEFAAGELNGKPRVKVYQDVLRQMNQLNKSVLDVALAKGLIDQNGYDKFSNDIYYIPFYKKMEEDGTIEGAQTASGLTSQYFSKELKGGEAPFGDLMENIVRNWSHILSASMKNAAAQTTINDAMELQAAEPNLKAGLEWKDGKVYSTSSGKPIEAKLDEDGKQIYAEGELRPDLTTNAAGMAKIMVNGQPMYFKVTDDLLMDSISSIGYMGPKSKFLDVARNFKNMLQYGVTASPIFKVNNLIRDSVSALAVSDLKKSPVYNVMTGISLSKKDSPTYISALAGGGIFNFGSAYEGDQAKLIKRLIDQGVDGDTILDSKEKITKALKKTWDAYQHLGDRSEAANRLALYQQMRDKGMSHLQASFMARDLLDFSMQGSWPAFRLITQVVPFMNARIQGLYKLGRDGINPTVRVLYNATTGKEIDANDKIRAAQFSVVTAAVMAASALLYLSFKDDEDFKKRDAWDRDNFWWFKIPSLDIAFRVPKPFEVGAFGTLVERSLEQIMDQGAEGKTFGDSLKRTLWDTFALNPTPQMFKPLFDLYANKDSFSGAPIESAGLERLSKQERMTEQTSPLAIALSKVWSTVMPAKVESSPIQVDYAIKGYFGWLGAMASMASTYAVMPFKEGEYPDARWLDRASLGLVRDLPAPQSAYVTAFYENAKEISQAYADMRHYREMGDAEKVQELLEEKGDKIALAKFYDKTAKNIANVRKQIQLITNDKNLDGAEKKEAIERMKLIMSDLAKQAEEVRKSMKP